MKKLLPIFFASFFLSSSTAISAATFSITNPSSGACYTPGQLVAIRWTTPSVPAADHYAVTFRTDSSTPPEWTTNSGSWSIGHSWGDLSKNTIGWAVPTMNSNQVRIWVEVHKKNDSRVDIASSGVFSVKQSCTSSTKPPTKTPTSTGNPPVVSPPNSVITPEGTVSSESATPNKKEPAAKELVETKKTVQPNYLALVLYLVLFALTFGASVFTFLNRQKIVFWIKQPKLPTGPMVEVKAPEPTRPKELTVEQIERLRLEEQAKASEETEIEK